MFLNTSLSHYRYKQRFYSRYEDVIHTEYPDHLAYKSLLRLDIQMPLPNKLKKYIEIFRIAHFKSKEILTSVALQPTLYVPQLVLQ